MSHLTRKKSSFLVRNGYLLQKAKAKMNMKKRSGAGRNGTKTGKTTLRSSTWNVECSCLENKLFFVTAIERIGI
jgi:hypothetical protein